jgi:hypothetical protein
MRHVTSGKDLPRGRQIGQCYSNNGTKDTSTFGCNEPFKALQPPKLTIGPSLRDKRHVRPGPLARRLVAVSDTLGDRWARLQVLLGGFMDSRGIYLAEPQTKVRASGTGRMHCSPCYGRHNLGKLGDPLRRMQYFGIY